MKIQYIVGGDLNEIEFDATIAETHSSSATVTERNVEKGANITDHVRPAQDRISVEAVVTNAPIRTPSGNIDGAKGDYDQIVANSSIGIRAPAFVGIPGGSIRQPLQTFATVLKFDKSFDRVRNVYEELVAIVSAPLLVSIDSGIRTYEDMVITSLSAPRTVEDAIHFSFEATHVRFVESSTVNIASAPEAKGRKKEGHKPPKEAKADGPEQSTLHSIKEGLKGVLGVGG